MKRTQYDRLHIVFVFNYICVIISFGIIISDACGRPDWYAVRVTPPVTPDGSLQFVSEHILRCKYSENSFLRMVPWFTIFLWNILLVQLLSLWVRLHMLEAFQWYRIYRGTAVKFEGSSYNLTHFVYLSAIGATLSGWAILVMYDHDSIPKNWSGTGKVLTWREFVYLHKTGVVMVVFGFILLHFLIIYMYIFRITSYHDYKYMCAGVDVEDADSSDSSVMPWMRRGLYAGCEMTNLVMICFFVVFIFYGYYQAVLIEYVLFACFLVISLASTSLSYRVRYIYDI